MRKLPPMQDDGCPFRDASGWALIDADHPLTGCA